MKFHTDEDPRLTATPAFREYQWRSETMRKNTWTLAKVDEATAKFFQTLVQLDREGFPKDSLNIDHATFRAHLGLPNCYNIKIDYQTGYTTKAAGAFWTSLLRFQVLDLLLSLAHGASDAPSPKEPPPNGTGPNNLLSALTKWPTYLEMLVDEYVKQKKDEHAKLPGSTTVKPYEGAPEAFAPMIALTDMHSFTLATKTSKNFQAMGAALMWILECATTDPFKIPVTMKIGDTFHGLHMEGKEQFKKLTVNTILRPLSYAINSSPVVAICNIDLSNSYGHVMSQYKTRAFVGRYRTPRLMHVENVIMTVIREVAIGKPVWEAMEEHWYSGIASLPPSRPEDCDIFKIVPSPEIAQSEIAQPVSLPPAPSPVSPAPPSPRLFSCPAALVFPAERQASRSLGFGLAMGICSWEEEPKTFSFSLRDNGDVNMTEEEPRDDGLGDEANARALAMTAVEGVSPTELSKEVDLATDAGDDVSAVEKGQDRPPQVGTGNLEEKGTGQPAKQSGDPVDREVGDEVGMAAPELPKKEATIAVQPTLQSDGEEVCGGARSPTKKGPVEGPIPDERDVDPPLVPDDIDMEVQQNQDQPEQLPHNDSNMFDGALSPLPSSPEPDSLMTDDSAVDVRRSIRLANPSPAQQSVLAQDVPAKRKASSQVRGPTKKFKVEKVVPAENHSKFIYPANLDLENPPERSTVAVKMWGYRPDGISKREFDWIGHANTDCIERPMMEALQRSMADVDARCTQNHRRWRHHVDGNLPTGPPTENEFDLYVMTKAQWISMSPSDHVALWGTGCNLFVQGLLATSEHLDTGTKLRSLHRLDQPIEVQVPGFRIAPVGEKDDGDNTKCIRTTTLRTFLEQANKDNGIVLNALKLPESHTVLPNPLAGSGLDLDDVAYRQTNGLPSFHYENVPPEQQFWQIAGTPDTLTPPHYDKGPTRVTSEGPGEKLWILRRSNHRGLQSTFAFETWDPDQAALESGQYEGVILPPNGGTLFMQSREHIVVGLPPPGVQSNSRSENERADQFTLVTGGHFVAASTIIPSTCMLLHLVMKEHILTNVEHDGTWSIFVRICAFWIDVTAQRPQDSHDLAPYLPLFSEENATGWMDIVSLTSVTILCTQFDRRHYRSAIPLSEGRQRQEVSRMYKRWRAWFSETFEGTINGKVIVWERDVFSAVLVHLAAVLIQYHDRARYREQEEEEVLDIFLAVSNSDLCKDVRRTLEAYDTGLRRKLDKKLNEGEGRDSVFFLFKGPEIALRRR
ncbi:hypothetical protein C8F04DRAFT_1255770 [Mycena alexandri]|uniref:Uncharacterized protein n=1 Tax=Mycena alexandri TaxID=1745969 RepID=A0AAD6T381_9AGAR|nr:hypothetical protein C8F04DRAFT_1255770 [Mycena alexandri]